MLNRKLAAGVLIGIASVALLGSSIQTIAYNLIEGDGSAVTQRSTLNFISGTGATVSVADNSGSARTDVTISASGGSGNPTITVSNALVTGTTVSTLTKLTGIPSTAVIAATTDTGGTIGITTSGAGTTGSATIQLLGSVSCVFDGATTAGDYVQISSSTAGNCHDSGASYPTSGQVVGRILSTNVAGGTYTMDLFPSEIKGSSGGGGAFTQLARTVVGTATASVHFATISGSYNHLVLQAIGGSSSAQTGDDVVVEINSDTGSNYDRQFLFNSGGTVIAGGQNGHSPLTIGTFVGTSSGSAAIPGSFTATFVGYSQTSFWKEAHAEGGWWDGSTTNHVTEWWQWRNTAAITDMILTLSSGGNFVTGSSFTLYGEN